VVGEMEVVKMAVDWGYYDKFDGLMDKYLPPSGEGETKATQIVTAVCKLVYKWYNDGDVYDNSYVLEGWANDLSSYANWLWEHTEANELLENIFNCINNSDYEDLLKKLSDMLLDESFLAEQNEVEKVGTIYRCDGAFKYVEHYDDDDEEEYDYEEDEEDEYEDGEYY
jgi:hypothetical protein